LSYFAKYTVTNSPFTIQASCSKCLPSAWIPFLTRVTTELVTLQSTAVLRKVTSSKGSIGHLLRYFVKCTVTNSPLNIQASCSKCLPSAWILFLTRVTRELVTLRSTAMLRNGTSSLVTRVRKFIQADVGHFEQLA